MRLLVLVVAALLLSASSAERPDPDDVALFARWLVSHSNFGVLATLGVKGVDKMAPFNTIVSFADAATDVPYFYLSPELDPSGNNSVADTRASFALSEALLGLCDGSDAQSPTCARLTLSGRLKLEEMGSEEEKFGEAALFAKHPLLTGVCALKGMY